MSVDVHCPVLPPLKRFTEDHQLLKQKHLSLAWLASLGVGYDQCVLKMRGLQFKTMGRYGNRVELELRVG